MKGTLQRSNPVPVRASVAAALVLMPALLGWLTGCRNSPYDQVMRDLDRPMEARLSDRIASVAQEHGKALAQFERTRQMLLAAAGPEKPGEQDLYLCEDEVDRCHWWVFNLNRDTLSITDIAPGAIVQPVGASEVVGVNPLIGGTKMARDSSIDDLLAEFEESQQLMRDAADQMAEVLASIQGGAGGAGGMDAAAALPDLSVLRAAVDRVAMRAEALLSGGTAGAADSGSRAPVAARSAKP